LGDTINNNLHGDFITGPNVIFFFRLRVCLLLRDPGVLEREPGRDPRDLGVEPPLDPLKERERECERGDKSGEGKGEGREVCVFKCIK